MDLLSEYDALQDCVKAVESEKPEYSNKKQEFIEDYIVGYPEQQFINSKFSYIVLIFNGACRICVLSLLEAKRFDYFRAILKKEMNNELNRFNDISEQYYYIVPSYIYESKCCITLEIFNILHRCSLSFSNKTIDEIIKKDMNISDISLQEKLKKEIKDLHDIFGFNPI
jgi:hypothetical protein